MHGTLLKRFFFWRSDYRRSNSSARDEMQLRGTQWLAVVAFVPTLVICGTIVHAQQPQKMARICYLTVGASSDDVRSRNAFSERLRELGHIEGKNLTIVYRYEEKIERLSEHVAALIDLKCEVIITGGIEATTAARNATKTVPIVIAFAPDAVRHGFVQSLSRPGGNITGQTNIDLTGKRLEILKEIVPKLSRVGFLWSPSNPDSDYQAEESEAAARSLRLTIQSLEVKSGNDIDSAFRAAVQSRVGALIQSRGGFFNINRKRIFELAVKHQLPAIYGTASYPEAGGLMAYAEDRLEQRRRTAVTVDKILNGAKPADLPVEQPTKFVFVVNLKIAKQIGLTIPPNVLARADRVFR